jgi:hypothetical protein
MIQSVFRLATARSQLSELYWPRVPLDEATRSDLPLLAPHPRGAFSFPRPCGAGSQLDDGLWRS